MAQFRNIFPIDLQTGYKDPVPLMQPVGEGDAKGLRVGARVTNNGADVDLGGQCVGYVRRPDGSTVPLTGTISGNQAYVTLDQTCCEIEGPIQVAVAWVSGTNITTLLVAYGTVVNTITGNTVQPSTPIPDLTQLLAEIDAMRQATADAEAAASKSVRYDTTQELTAAQQLTARNNISAARAGIIDIFAVAFDATRDYYAGDYCTYSGSLWRFTADHPAGAWKGDDPNPANRDVTTVTVGNEINNTTVKVNKSQSLSGTNKAQARANIDAAAIGTLAVAFDASTTYHPGEYCTRNGNLYRFTAEHTGAWNNSHVVAVTVGNEINTTTVKTNVSQSLTDDQKTRARNNIGAASAADLSTETTARETADSNLNSQVGDLKSALNDTAFFSGNGNTYTEQDFALVKAGKSYKAKICSWDTSGVTVTGGYTKFYLGYKNNGTKVKIAEILMSGAIENEYNVQIPANAVNPVLVIGGRVTASKQGVVRVEDISINAEINKNSNRIGKIDLISQFEVGDIGITNTGWSYGVSNSRVRTKYGVTFHLYPGDTVGLTDYSNYRYYTGLRKTDGAYGLYAWRQSDLPITVEGDYVFLIDHVTSTEVTDKTELASLFFGFDGVAYESIRATDYLSDRLVALYMPLLNGYLTTNGSISTDGQNQEVTTDYIPATKGDEFVCSYSFDTSKSMWLAYCSYDANKRLIGSRNVPINSLSSASGTAVISVSADNAQYIRISYRTYGSISMQIKTSNISKVLSKRISDTNNMISEQNYAVNKHVKSINHRGYALCPENTLTAFRASKKEGFGIVETDVRFTSDGVPVLLHDESINRTARNADGSAISGTINIADITYAQAAEYDFGVYKGAEYAGVKIPKYEDFLKLCRAIGLDCYIELKAGTEAQIRSLVDMGALFGMREHITWIGPESYLAVVSVYDQSARIGFIAGSLSQQSAENMLSYKTSSNDVFADLNYYDSSIATSLSIAKSAGLPVEVWSVNYTAAIISMDSYITGVTSDYYVAGYVLYDDAIRNDYIGV